LTKCSVNSSTKLHLYRDATLPHLTNCRQFSVYSASTENAEYAIHCNVKQWRFLLCTLMS